MENPPLQQLSIARPRSHTLCNIWNATTWFVDLAALCTAENFDFAPNTLPLGPHGRLLPQIRLLRFGWLHDEHAGLEKPAFANGVHTIAQMVLPASEFLEHLTVDAQIPDLLRILGYAACHPALQSLHIKGTTIIDMPPRLTETVMLATYMLSFARLRELDIPSSLINDKTMPLIASIQGLERLDVVANGPSCWLGACKPPLDNWVGLMHIPGGFPSLVRLGLHQVAPAQMTTLVQSNCFNAWPRTVEISGTIDEDNESDWCPQAYLDTFRSMSAACGQVKTLQLAISYLDLDARLLEQLAVLQQLDVLRILATEATALRAATSLWPHASIQHVQSEMDLFTSRW
jgi:hypothetical protein